MRGGPLLLISMLLIVSLPQTFADATPTIVTLEGDTTGQIGSVAIYTGHLEPAVANVTIALHSGTAKVGEGTTDHDGDFIVWFHPDRAGRHTVTATIVHPLVGPLSSDPIDLQVTRPIGWDHMPEDDLATYHWYEAALREVDHKSVSHVWSEHHGRLTYTDENGDRQNDTTAAGTLEVKTQLWTGSCDDPFGCFPSDEDIEHSDTSAEVTTDDHGRWTHSAGPHPMASWNAPCMTRNSRTVIDIATPHIWTSHEHQESDESPCP